MFEFNKYEINEYTPEEILIEREERADFIHKLYEQYKETIIVLRVNYPGIRKANEISVGIGETIAKEILNRFRKYSYCNFNVAAEGPILILVVPEDPISVKNFTVEIEEKHPLGRLVDLDVYSKGKGISRTELNMPSRTCYICGNSAQVCVRSKKHKLDEIEKYIKDKYENYIGDTHSRR